MKTKIIALTAILAASFSMNASADEYDVYQAINGGKQFDSIPQDRKDSIYTQMSALVLNKYCQELDNEGVGIRFELVVKEVKEKFIPAMNEREVTYSILQKGLAAETFYFANQLDGKEVLMADFCNSYLEIFGY